MYFDTFSNNHGFAGIDVFIATLPNLNYEENKKRQKNDLGLSILKLFNLN